MKKMMLSMICVFALFCAEGQSGGDSHGHNSRSSISWDGIYRGTLPCADCEGLQLTIALSRNMHYKVSTKYLGKSDSSYVYSGTFSWNKEGTMITLSDSGRKGWSGMYLVGEGMLTQLDGAGNKISGELANRFILTKAAYAILEKYWKLVELNGKPVTVDSTMKREPYITFKDKENKLAGFAGCNNISGTYIITAPDRLALTKMISTQMACPRMDLESEFLKTLQRADSFTIRGDQLVLNRARMAPLARFKTVYMK